MSAEQEALTAQTLSREMAFADRNGRQIVLGSLVRYAFERRTVEFPTNPWNTDRWGIVTGMARTRGLLDTEDFPQEADVSVRVTAVDVTDGDGNRWSNTDFFCQPDSLVVLA